MLAWIFETIKVSFEPGLEKRWQNEKLELQFFCRKKLGNCSKDTFYLTDCACSLSKKVLLLAGSSTYLVISVTIFTRR
ncbi:hypothetical protein EB796_017957 [Bugula neritina]|uniref:Uncharacterized protein n=1 Tax=Bugula neritina TaxID=10212 RepID=A0A7J7JBV0_BUGNE|nr:hypothetical protein EB796_017957 [Bugula neritina]